MRGVFGDNIRDVIKVFKGTSVSSTSSSEYHFSEKVISGEATCQNCGKMVIIILPFMGCVFCGDCFSNDSGQNDGTEDFYEPRRISLINP